MLMVFKKFVVGVLNRIDLHLPLGAAVRVRNRWLFGRPSLDYLEIHLADHCNMNCAGCTHYSPYLERRLADVGSVRRDFARLRGMFANVRRVRLMGGEPLLHPEVTAFMQIVREAFPKSHVTLTTNGLLLAKQSADFWEACRKWRIGIDFTVYPPMVAREGAIRALCSAEKVPLRVTPNGAFLAKLDAQGKQPMKSAFRACRKGNYCPILRDGKIYHCAEACYAEAYNRKAGTRIPAEMGMELATHTGMDVLKYLMCPVFACCHCSARHRVFEWHNTETCPEDWLA